MTKKATKIVSALFVVAAIITILGFVLNLTRGEQGKGDNITVESQGQSGGTTAGKVGDTYDVESRNQSGGITAGKIEKLVVVNPQKPKLVLSPDRTKVQVTDGVYEKRFYFRNPEGLALRNVLLKVTFDREFASVKADKWVWTGMIAKGSERLHPDPSSNSLLFYTAALEAIAFIEVIVTSKHDIQIKDVEFKTE